MRSRTTVLESKKVSTNSMILTIKATYFLGFSTPQLPICEAGLGLENNVIPDSSAG